MCGGGGLVTYIILYRYTLFSVLRHCSAGNLSFARKNDYSWLNGRRSSTLAWPTSQNPSCKGVELPSTLPKRCCTTLPRPTIGDDCSVIRYRNFHLPLPCHAKVHDSTANHPLHESFLYNFLRPIYMYIYITCRHYQIRGHYRIYTVAERRRRLYTLISTIWHY